MTTALMTRQKPGNKTIAQRSGKQPFGYYRRDARKIDETQAAEFARLLYSECKNGDKISKEKIGKLIKHVTNTKSDITHHIIGAWISKARGIIIKEYNETFIYTADGYKIATGAEKPLAVAKIGQMAYKWKHRFLFTSIILSPEEHRVAGADMITRIKKDLGNTNLPHGQVMLDSFKEDMKTLRIEAKNV